MKKSRIIVLAILVLALVSVFSGAFGQDGSFTRNVLAGYGGSGNDKKDPTLDHDPVSKAYVGDQIKLSAEAKDSDSGIDKVTLRYRVDGGRWKSVTMKNKGSRVYRATINAPKKPGNIEYYIKAEDEAGNEKYSGKTSDPHVIKVMAKFVRSAQTVAPKPQPQVQPQTQPVQPEQPKAEEKKNETNGSVEGTETQNEDSQEISGDSDENDGSSKKNIAIVIGAIILAGLGAWYFSLRKPV